MPIPASSTTGRNLPRKNQGSSRITDVTTDQLNAGPLLDVTDQARSRFELRHPALHHRQYARRRLRPAHRLDHVHHAATSITSCSRSTRNSSTRPKRSTTSTSNRPAASRCRCRRWSTRRVEGRAAGVNHQGQFPSVTISFNLAPGASIGQAVSGIQPSNRAASAAVAADQLPGQRPGFRSTRCRARRS